MHPFAAALEARNADAAVDDVVFRARIGDREIDGCDFLHLDERGSIDELVVMVRPLSGTLALAEAMKEQLAPPAA